VTGTSPTARQRELGARLRGLRNDHNMTVEEVAEKLLCSATKISRLETGARRPSLRDVRDLCGLYEVGEPTSAELMSLAKEARVPGWWTQYSDLNLDPFIGLEEAAAAITCYSMNYVPGLLQTKEYAHGIIEIIAPKMDPQVVQQRVEARLRRQQVLEKDNSPRYQVVLDESVLRRGVGGPTVMAAQIDKVLGAVASDKAIVQIISFDAGAYVAADGYFVLLEFAEATDLWPVVFIEGLAGNQYLERRVDIARYRETIDYLLTRALSSSDSVKLMTKVRNILRQQGNNHVQGLLSLRKELTCRLQGILTGAFPVPATMVSVSRLHATIRLSLSAIQTARRGLSASLRSMNGAISLPVPSWATLTRLPDRPRVRVFTSTP
jgi:transcriptional regulator with XRE-family HTH domain